MIIKSNLRHHIDLRILPSKSCIKPVSVAAHLLEQSIQVKLTQVILWGDMNSHFIPSIWIVFALFLHGCAVLATVESDFQVWC